MQEASVQEAPAARKKTKELLTKVVARLEEQLDYVQQRLAVEEAVNLRARAHVASLQVIFLARSVLQQMLTRGGGAAEPMLTALNQQSELLSACVRDGGPAARPPGSPDATCVHSSSALNSALCSEHSAATPLAARLGPALGSGSYSAAGPGPGRANSHDAASAAGLVGLALGAGAARALRLAGGGSDDGTGGAPTVGAVGVSAAEFLKSVAAARGANEGKDAFAAWWRERVMRLAMLTHQYRNGAATRATLEETLLTMGSRLVAVLVTKRWAVELFARNLDTGEDGEPPRSTWDRVAACMALAPSTAPALLHLSDWWRRVRAALEADRRALLRRVLEPGARRDPDALAAVLAQMDAAYGAFVADGAALATAAHAALLSPEQLAEAYLTSWPHLPSPAKLAAAALDAMARAQHRRIP